MKKILEYIIRASDKTKPGTDEAKKNADSAEKGIRKNLANIKAGWDMIYGATKTAVMAISNAVKMLWKSITEAFKLETMTLKFATLTGSIDKARAKIKELSDFASHASFGFESIVAASQQLHKFSGGALGGAKTLKLLGDAAAATGNDISEVANAVGRTYAQLKSGQSISLTTQLQMMGAITPEVAIKMKDLQEAGAKNIEVWRVLETHLATFRGGMDTMRQSGDVLITKVKESWSTAVAEFGSAFSNLAKEEMTYLISRLNTLVKDGSVKKWAEQAMTAIKPLAEIIGNLFDDQNRGESLNASWDYLKSVFKYGLDSIKAGADYLQYKFQAMLAKSLPPALGGNADMAKQYDTLATNALSLGMRTAENTFARTRADAVARIAEAAAKRRAGEGTSDNIAQKAYTEKFEAYRRREITLDELNDLTRDLAAIMAERKDKMEDQLIVEDMARSQAMVEERRKNEATKKLAQEREKAAAAEAQNAAKDRVQRATQAAQLAWAEYRDPELRRKNQAERQAEAEARQEYQRDLAKLRDRYTDRDTALDDLTERDIEKMRDWEQAAMSVYKGEQEKKASEEALKQIEKNTAELAEKLDNLLVIKEE